MSAVAASVGVEPFFARRIRLSVVLLVSPFVVTYMEITCSSAGSIFSVSVAIVTITLLAVCNVIDAVDTATNDVVKATGVARLVKAEGRVVTVGGQSQHGRATRPTPGT